MFLGIGLTSQDAQDLAGQLEAEADG